MINTDMIYGIVAIVVPLVQLLGILTAVRGNECPDIPGCDCLGHFACDLPLAGAGAVCDFRAQQIQWISFF